MKKIVFSLFTALLATGCYNPTNGQKETPTIQKIGQIDAVSRYVPDRVDTLIAMATAFAMQESKLDENAVSPSGRYVGCLQISKIMVAEANRICRAKIFWCDKYFDDRKDRQGSFAIFMTVMEYHNPTLDIDKAVDIWNPKCPQSYRRNVKNNYAKLLKTCEENNYFD